MKTAEAKGAAQRAETAKEAQELANFSPGDSGHTELGKESRQSTQTMDMTMTNVT